jgi:hypothetical protein
MRRLARPVPLLLAALALGGCTLDAAIGPAAVVMGTSLILIGKTPADVVASVVTGENCSAVHLERRQPWCLAAPGPPEPAPFCTRSLGRVDCWTVPPQGAPLRGVADPPR